MRKDDEKMKKMLCLILAAMCLLAVVSCEKENDETAAAFAVFSYNGVQIPIGAEAAPILTALGGAPKVASTASCYGDDFDRIYEYTSFQVETYTRGGVEYVMKISVINDIEVNVQTPEGVRIGTKREDVLAVYGTPTEESDAALVYLNSSNQSKLQILFRNGAVTGIQYLLLTSG